MRRLGPLRVGDIGLGCMGLSAVYDPGSVSEAEGIAVIHRAIDLGVTLFDTSDAYGPFTNEQLVGKAIAGRVRDDLTIATKAGCAPNTESFVPKPDGRPETLAKACDASLQRLGIDVIDLWQLHRVDPEVPIEESIGAMADQVIAGKVRHLGVSEVTLDELQRAHGTFPLAALQSELSVWTRHLRDEQLPWCEAHGIGVIAFSPLGRGFLAGSIPATATFDPNDARASNPRFTPEALAANQRIAGGIRALAERRNAAPAQVALGWVLAQGDHVVPIQGATTVAQLEENLRPVRLVPGELDWLDSLPPATGDRY